MMWLAKLTGVQKLLAGLGSILLLAAAFYGYGEYRYHAGNQQGLLVAKNQVLDYQNQLLNTQLKLSQLQQGSDKVIVERYYHNTETIRETAAKNSNVITDNIKPRFTLTRGWIYAHNQAAAGNEIDPVLAADQTEASVNEVQALLTVTGNYGKCQANAEMLTRLQEWITTTKANVDEANKQREQIDADKKKEVTKK